MEERISWMNKPNKHKAGTCLNYQSYHQTSIFRSMLHNALRRAKTLSSEEKQQKAMMETGKILLNNGFPKGMVLEALKTPRKCRKKKDKSGYEEIYQTEELL